MKTKIEFNMPYIYQPRKHFLSCLDYLLCSYINAHKIPYQLLLTDSWGFFYEDISTFDVNESRTTPLYQNMEGLLGMSKRSYNSEKLLSIINKVVVEEESYIFTSGEGKYLPWHPTFRTADNPHFFLITDFNAMKNEVYIVDLVPQYSGWVDLKIIDEAYSLSSKLCFQLSVPHFDGDLNTTLQKGILRCVDRVLGVEEQISKPYKTGILGLTQFKSDFVKKEFNDLNIIDIWWKSLKVIIDVRDGFLELLYYLQNCSIESVTIEVNELRIIDETLNSWFAFRNGLKRAQLTNNFSKDIHISRLEKIIDQEQKSAIAIKNMLR
ncbi:hypothetical protein GC096_04115 [Paenibacillus sp. LMG 31461]|uniref:Butirosin biosynthesis protein H N-terminal domain-containing protein n=1 Tax=Paenibacillus plantarum TaxID=2654975 RepID=A0ABX1X494_9BACL|nr:hypothetical protein [Paenibacillus plantarum]NOU63232.1 hypothetical protein [Paenibacillus plantarum]